MHRLRAWKLAAPLLAILIVAGGATAALAVTSKLHAQGDTWVRIARENTTTASATANSTNYIDIPGARLSVPVPNTPQGSILLARFQGHGSVIKTSGCIVRVLANETPMEPGANYAFMGQANVSESVAGSGAIERSLAVNGGTYVVKAQLRLSTANSVDSLCLLTAWHFVVERMNV
jgi:hypothetical protein